MTSPCRRPSSSTAPARCAGCFGRTRSSRGCRRMRYCRPSTSTYRRSRESAVRGGSFSRDLIAARLLPTDEHAARERRIVDGDLVQPRERGPIETAYNRPTARAGSGEEVKGVVGVEVGGRDAHAAAEARVIGEETLYH